jgi:sugar (pentulose or hexulose) kinase
MAHAGGVCIGIDIGTQGCKVLALDLQSNTVIGRGEAQYGIIPSSVPGRAEQQPETWIQVRHAHAKHRARLIHYQHSPYAGRH